MTVSDYLDTARSSPFKSNAQRSKHRTHHGSVSTGVDFCSKKHPQEVLLRARWGEILDEEKMKKCVWVRPKLVAVVEFLEWTEGDRLRHSKFVALRDDKNPRDVVKEV